MLGFAICRLQNLNPVYALTILVNFILLAFIIFMMVKQLNRLCKAKPAPTASATPEDIVLLREIRDALKK
jgi:large conductance mechanosensitive channel